MAQQATSFLYMTDDVVINTHDGHSQSSPNLQSQRSQPREPSCLHSLGSTALQGRDSVRGYFPAGTWYSLMGGPTVDAPEAGRLVTLKAPLGQVPVHVLGGTIVPMQARSWLSPLQSVRPDGTVATCLHQRWASVCLIRCFAWGSPRHDRLGHYIANLWRQGTLSRTCSQVGWSRIPSDGCSTLVRS